MPTPNPSTNTKHGSQNAQTTDHSSGQPKPNLPACMVASAAGLAATTAAAPAFQDTTMSIATTPIAGVAGATTAGASDVHVDHQQFFNELDKCITNNLYAHAIVIGYTTESIREVFFPIVNKYLQKFKKSDWEHIQSKTGISILDYLAERGLGNVTQMLEGEKLEGDDMTLTLSKWRPQKPNSPVCTVCMDICAGGLAAATAAVLASASASAAARTLNW